MNDPCHRCDAPARLLPPLVRQRPALVVSRRRAVVTYSGAGGSTKGLHDAGYDTIGFDWWLPACRTGSVWPPARSRGAGCWVLDVDVADGKPGAQTTPARGWAPGSTCAATAARVLAPPTLHHATPNRGTSTTTPSPEFCPDSRNRTRPPYRRQRSDGIIVWDS